MNSHYIRKEQNAFLQSWEHFVKLMKWLKYKVKKISLKNLGQG